MLHILNYCDLVENHAELARTMFVDRAEQFGRRLGWNVDVDVLGRERDQYDLPGTEYIVWADGGDRHLASMRLRPTSLPTMASEHFADLWPSKICDPNIWESTRFVANPAAKEATRLLVFASHTYCLMRGAKAVLGVYEQGMERVYRRLGWGPVRLGMRSSGSSRICSGQWSVDLLTYERLRSCSNVTDGEVKYIVEACEASIKAIALQKNKKIKDYPISNRMAA